jgi:hypothetical protein
MDGDGSAKPFELGPQAQRTGDGVEALPRTADERPATGHLEGIDDEGRVLFRPEGHLGAPFPVAIGVPLTDAALIEAASRKARAVVLVARDPEQRVVLVGLVRDRVQTSSLRGAAIDASLDGETVRLEAAQRIELVCGKASIILEADGHVTISGTHVVSASRGPNKIKGSTVTLN